MSSHAVAGSHVEGKASWRDWVTLVVGAYVALATLWTAGAPAVWFLALGVLMFALAFWGMSSEPNQGYAWSLIVVGVVTFIAPWLGAFAAATAAGWTMWIAGVVAAAMGGIEVYLTGKATA